MILPARYMQQPGSRIFPLSPTFPGSGFATFSRCAVSARAASRSLPFESRIERFASRILLIQRVMLMTGAR